MSEDEIVEFPDAPADNIWHKAIDNESYTSTQHWVLQADDDVCNSNYSMLSIESQRSTESRPRIKQLIRPGDFLIFCHIMASSEQ